MRRTIMLALILTTTGLVIVQRTANGQEAAVVQQMVAGEGEAGDCVICHEDCPEGWHLAAPAGTYSIPAVWTRNGGVHLNGECFTGSCATKHGPACTSGSNLAAADVQALRKSILKRDPQAIRSLIAAHPKNMVHNGARSAVQLMNCSGQVIAHLPLSATLSAQIG